MVRLLAVASLVLAVAGCSVNQRSDAGLRALSYQAPSASVAGPTEAMLTLNANAAANVVGQSAQRIDGVEVTPLNARARAQGPAVVVTYSGAPQSYIDCGETTYAGRAGEVSLPASAETTRLAGTEATNGAPITRTMRLDIRTVLRFANRGAGSTAAIQSTYIVSRTASAQGVSPPAVTVAEFDQTTAGELPPGVVCRATGAFEERILRPAASGATG